jgi:hypothetical protein
MAGRIPGVSWSAHKYRGFEVFRHKGGRHAAEVTEAVPWTPDELAGGLTLDGLTATLPGVAEE